ncbi:reverse transcriptase domain-containing protein [Tanacetum coccineum]
MVYLLAANEAVIAVLLVERHGRQAPIYYISRTLQGAKINYPPMEKLVLALVHAARRLRRLAKWGIDLEAYGIKYAPRSAIKGQVLADFLANTMEEDSSTQVKVSFILIDPKGAKYSYALRLNFANSRNDAEYEALLAGLRIAAKIKVEKIHAFVDLKLVASQVEGSYEAKSEKTKKYKEKAVEMIRSFNNFQISHIPREDNKKADALSKLAAVQCEGLTKGVLIKELNE